jgi:uncharacterized membrane protein YfcA
VHAKLRIMDAWELLVIIIIGAASGFIGAITGGGGLISIPTLIFMGLPANVAVGTNRLGSFGIIGAALPKYWRAKKINRHYLPYFMAIAVGGGFIGSNISASISTEILSKIVGVLLILLLPILFIDKNIGLSKFTTSRKRQSIGYVALLILMIYGGFFGGGGGVLLIYAQIYFFGFTSIEARATDMLAWFCMAIVAFLIFLSHGIVNFQVGLTLMVGMVIGAHFGARTALLKGNAWVKWVFALVVLASSIKLLFV